MNRPKATSPVSSFATLPAASAARRPLVLCLAMAALPLNLLAADWDGTIGNWSEAANWNPDGVPDAVDANIFNGGTVTLDATVANVNLLQLGGTSTLNVVSGAVITTNGDFRTGQGAGNSAITNISGTATIVSNGEFQIGNALGTGVVNMTGGSVTVNSWVAIGRDGGTGTLNLSGGTFTKGGGSGTFDIGTFGSGATPAQGTLTQTGGSVVNTGSTTNIGRDATGSGLWNMSGGTATLAGLSVGAGGTGIWNMTNGATATVGGINISLGGAGTWTMGGTGTTATTGQVNVGNGGVGNWTMNTGATASTGIVLVGANGAGSGTLTVSGGTVNSSDYAKIGANGGTGTLNISDGALNTTNYFVVGDNNSVGTVNQTGGTITFNQWAVIAGGGSGTATSKWDISGGNVTSAAGLEVGADRTGTMNISGTGNVAVGSMALGVRTGGNGIVNKTGGTLTTKNLGIAGAQSGTAFGTFNLTGGTTTITSGGGQSYVGNRAGSIGTLNVSSGAVIDNVSSQDWQIGFNGGTGNINVSGGGTVNHNWWLNVARGAGSVGTVSVEGTDSKVIVAGGQTNIGEDGTGTLNITNGGKLSANQEFSIARNGGSTGTVTISGASSLLDLTADAFVGRNGTGTLNVNGGLVNLHDRRLQITEGAGGNGTVNLNGGAVQVSYVQAGPGTVMLSMDGGELRANAAQTDFLRGFTTGNSELQANGLVLNSNGFNVTATTPFDGIGGITKTGDGVLTLSGIMTYTGVTTVNQGSISANAYTGPGGITKAGNGVITLTGVSDNTGTTIVNAGTLTISANDRLTTTAPLTVNGGAFDVAAFNQTTGMVTLSGGTLTGGHTAVGTGNLIGSSFNFQKGTSEAVLAGAGALTKSTADTVTLRGNSTFTGGSTVSAGTLSIGHDNAFGTGNVVVTGGKLQFDNSGLYEGLVAAGTNSFDQTTPVPKGTVVFDTPRGNSTDQAAFGGTSTWGYVGSIVVPGNSNVTWSFAEQFDDSVKLAIDANAGVINDGGWNTPTQGTVTLTPGKHTFEVRFGQGGGGVGPNSGWNIGFGVDTQGRGTTDAANYVALSDASFVNNLRHDITVANPIQLDVVTEVAAPYNYSLNTLTGIVSGNGGINKTGPGTVLLTAANTYTGGSTVNEGRLILKDNVSGSSNFVTNAELEFNVTTGSQQLSGGTISGTGNLLKTGNGQLLLGANGAPQTIALTGATSIIDVQAGVLRNEYGNSAWGGNLAGLNVASGAIFDLWDGNATVDELTGSGTINKGWNSNGTLTIGANNGSGIFTGTIYNNRTDLPHGGNAGGNLSLTKLGSGTQTLTANNTYAGGTNVNGGTIISGGGSLGTGTLSIASGGTVAVNQTANTGLASLYYNSAPVNDGGLDPAYNNLSTLRGRAGSLTPFTVVTTPVMDLNHGGATIPAGVGGDNYQGYYSGMVNITTGGSYAFSTGSDDGSMVWVDGQLVVSNNHYQGYTYPQVTGSVSLTPGYHSIVVGFYEGGGGDSLKVGINGADTGNVDVTLGASGPAVTPDLVVGSLAGAGGDLQLTTGGLIVGTDNTSQSGAATISGIGGVMKVGSGSQTLTGANTYTGGTFLTAGKLILGGASGTAAGAGDLTITPSSGWPNNGVELATNQTVGVVHFIGSDFNGLRPQGNTLTTAGLDSTNGKGVIENNGLDQVAPSGNGTVMVNTAASTSYTYNGYFRDFDNVGGTKLNLTKTGPGTQILVGSNITFSGTTTINGGILQLNTGSQAGTLAGQGPIVINNGGTLVGAAVDATGYYTNNGNNNSITVNQGGTLTVAADQRLSMDRNLYVVGGNVSSAAGANFNSGASYTFRDTGNGPVNHYSFSSALDGTSALLSAKDAGLHNNATFNVLDGPGAVDLDVTGNLVDNFAAGSFTKAGPGTVRFSGNNTYTGVTNLTGGTLLLGASNTLPDAAALNLSSGTTLQTGGFSDSTGALSVNGNAVFDMAGGDATLAFNSVGTWTGVLSIWNYTGAPWTLGTDKLTFATNQGNIALGNVHFYSDNGGNEIGTGGGGLIGNELVPVPEPSAALAALMLLGTLGYRERRRILHFRC